MFTAHAHVWIVAAVLMSPSYPISYGQTSSKSSSSKTSAPVISTGTKTSTAPPGCSSDINQVVGGAIFISNGYYCRASAMGLGTSSSGVPNVNWGAVASTHISASDLAQTCQNALSHMSGQVDASSVNAYQVSCSLGAKCLPQCSGLGNNEAVSSCIGQCFGFDDAKSSVGSLSPDSRQKLLMDTLLNATSAATHSGTLIDPGAFAQAGTDPVDQNMQDLLNDDAAPHGSAISADSKTAVPAIPDQSDSSNPQDAQDLLEEGLSQTTGGQIVTDVQEMGSGDGQEQLNGTFDLADKGNDQFNTNFSSKYVLGESLPLLHNAWSNAMNVVNAMGQDTHCLTDPTCSSGFGTATEKQLDQLFSHPFSPPANENIFDQ